MPTWASLIDIPTTNLDAGSDSPANARADLKAAVDNLNAMRAGRGSADGVASLDSTGKIPSAQLPASVVMRPRTVIKAAGSSTYTVPSGVTMILVKLWGGGGGGGYTSVGTGGDHGGGGGGGGYAEKYFDVTPGAVFNYTVGAGGTGKANSSDGNGADGSDTTFTSPGSGVTPASTTVTAQAGAGGFGPPTRFGGAGGYGTNGDIVIRGGAGASGSAKGGMGGGAANGSQAQAGAPKSDGYGGGGFGSGGGTSGFDGMNGTIEIWY
jgi:hypothetical protein